MPRGIAKVGPFAKTISAAMPISDVILFINRLFMMIYNIYPLISPKPDDASSVI
jgi:hypothetical protein